MTGTPFLERLVPVMPGVRVCLPGAPEGLGDAVTPWRGSQAGVLGTTNKRVLEAGFRAIPAKDVVTLAKQYCELA